MKMITAFCLLALSVTACGSLKPQTAVTLSQDSLLAVEVLGTLAKSVEAAADTKVITVHEARQVLDIDKRTVKVIKAGNSSGLELAKAALVEIGQLPFAAKLKPYLFTAQLALAKPATSSVGPVDGEAIVRLVQLFLPSLLGFIAKRRADGLGTPTLEELEAHVRAEADSVLADIDSWEALNPDPQA